MKYVSMHEVAFDPTDIVFPGLGHCHGIVYQTNVGLFAMHIFGGPDDTPLKAAMFARFVQGHALGQGAQGVALFGACPTIRFPGTGAAGQKLELQACAKALGFNGPLEGAMWDLTALGWHTTFVQFDLAVGGNVRVRIEDFTTGLIPTVPNPDHPNHQLTRRTALGPNAFGGRLDILNDVVLAPVRMVGVPAYNITPVVL